MTALALPAEIRDTLQWIVTRAREIALSPASSPEVQVAALRVMVEAINLLMG